MASANYQIGYTVQTVTFNPPYNMLADGSCCNSDCNTQQCCSASIDVCSPTLRLCFRELEHPIEDTNSECFLVASRIFGNQTFAVLGTDTPEIERLYSVCKISLSHNEYYYSISRVGFKPILGSLILSLQRLILRHLSPTLLLTRCSLKSPSRRRCLRGVSTCLC